MRPITLFIALFFLLAAVGIGFAAYVRLAPSDPDLWHVDPLTAPDPGRPHFSRVDRVVPMPPETVAAAIAGRAQAEGAVLLAGGPEHGTWLARTAVMRFPDYVSIRLMPEGEGTRIIALSRSRFGYSDRGLNRARLGRWLPQ